jgi:hypothetical protein
LHARTLDVQVSGLSLPEQFTLVNAPIDPFDAKQRRAFLEFTTTYAEGHPVLFNQGLMPAGPPASEPQMADAESLHKVGCCSNAGSFKYGLGCLGFFECVGRQRGTQCCSTKA